jgi:hypothetical protein
MKRLTKDEFIERARKVHGNRYDYSKVEYINNSTNVCIICPVHGEFWQKPHNHINGKGCRKCSDERTRERCSYSSKDFVEKAQLIHGDKYDYSKVNYVSAKKKVCIICPIHGEFWQVPNYHIDGCGCPRCGKESLCTHNMSNSKIYKVHSGMMARCNNPNSFKFDCYGGRGIRVCEEWLKFENFYVWAVQNGYKDGLTIERIDVNGNYEPSNCRWIPQRQQYYNQRRTKFINLHGRNISISELKDRLGIKRGVLEYYLSRYGNDKVVSYLKENFAKELIICKDDE